MKQKVEIAGRKTSEAKATQRSNWVYPALLFFVFIWSYSHIFDAKLDLNGDNFGYLNYASSILQGKGYSSPYSADFPATNWFPPGYSTILATLMLVFGQNIVLLKIANGLFFLGAILLFYTLIRKITGNVHLAFVVCFLLLMNSGLLRLATILMSEVPYIFFSILALYFLTKLHDDIKIWKSKYFYGVLLAAVAAFYIRSIAIVLIGAIILYWLIEKKWKRALSFIGGFAVLYIPWMIRNAVYGIKGRYLDAMFVVNNWRPEEGHISTISAFFDKIQVNFYDTVIKGFTDVIFPFAGVGDMSKMTVIFIGVIVLVIVFLGAWKTGRYRFLFCSYIVGNILVFLMWHPGNGSRYVWPLAPFVAFCFFYGFYRLADLVYKARKKDIPKFAPYLYLIFVFFSLPMLNNMKLAAAQDYDPAYKNYFDMAKTVKKQGGKNLVIACRKPDMFYFFSGTYVTCYAYSLDDKEVIRDLLKKKVDFVVLEQLGYGSTGRYLYPAIIKNQELFPLAMHLTNPDTYLLYFEKEKAKQKLSVK
jgi:hypothetical protein